MTGEEGRVFGNVRVEGTRFGNSLQVNLHDGGMAASKSKATQRFPSPLSLSRSSTSSAVFSLQRTWRSSQLLDLESLPSILSRMPRTRPPADFLRVTAPPPMDISPRLDGFFRLNCKYESKSCRKQILKRTPVQTVMVGSLFVVPLYPEFVRIFLTV